MLVLTAYIRSVECTGYGRKEATAGNHNAYIKCNVQKTGKSNPSLEIAGLWNSTRMTIILRYDYIKNVPQKIRKAKKPIGTAYCQTGYHSQNCSGVYLQ